MSTPAKPQESTASSLLRPTVDAITTFVRSASQRRKNKPPLIFPPPSWNLDETQNNGAGASHVPDEPIIPKELSEDTVPIEDAPEPQAFAQRISTLIDELPPPPTTTEDAPIDPKGPPLPPAVSKDSKLMKLLSSEHVMNGSLSRGRQSVWSILEHLKHKASSSIAPVEPQKGDVEQHKHDHDREDEGVMMYGPLEPTPDSKLELADSEIVLEYFDEPEPEKSAQDTTKPQPTPDASKPPSADAPKTVPPAGKKPSAKSSRFKERTYWVPSPTKISLQATWWGYRLYLPPPVMKILDNTHLAAAKRGAMISASLKWMLDRVPIVALPLQLRPAMRVLKRLTPYLGYIGVFVAWSWNAIKARDKGDGVVLTATWLLPVALVPGTLKPEDYQRGNGGANEVAAKPKEPEPQVPPASTSKGSQQPSKGGVDTK